MTSKTEKDFWIEMSIYEIGAQTEFALIAYSNIDLKAERGNNALFSSIHSFLSHCTVISKMLKAKDGETASHSIGDVLQISTASMIHKREFRNALEHYDERLKGWIKKYGPDSSIAVQNIGPKKMVQIPNMVTISHYDPETQIFTFVNDDFDLGMMHAEVQKIKGIANDWLSSKNMGKITPPYI